MAIERASAVKLGTFVGVTFIAAVAHHFGLGEHVAGWLGTALALGSEGALSLAGHWGVDLLDTEIDEHAGGAEARARGAQNHDLHRLTGGTIARILEREADGAPGGRFGAEYLQRAAAAFRTKWMMVELSGNETALSEPALPSYFTGDAESIKQSPVLEEAEWVALVERVAGRATFREYDEALTHAAGKLRERFAFELWEAAKDAWKTGDLAWPALILRLLSLTLGNSERAAANSEASAAQLTELRREIRTLSDAVGKAADAAARIAPSQFADRSEMWEAIRAYRNDLNSQLGRIGESVAALVEIGSWSLLRLPEPKTGSIPQGFTRFRYESEVDRFAGREHEMDLLLSSFLRLPAGREEQFRWHVLLGEAGVGKSRFGLELANRAKQWPEAGFLEPKAVPHAFPKRWQPGCPTFLIADYASDEAKYGKDQMRILLEYLAGLGGTLRYPVRILLIDRKVDGERIESLVRRDRAGTALEKCRHLPKEPLVLESLERAATIGIMRGRMPRQASDKYSDAVLDEALKAIDPDRTALFAALVGDEIGRGIDPESLLSASDGNISARCEFLRSLLQRERERWMHIANARWSEAEAERQVESHERLLALLTFTRGLRRAKVDDDNDFANAEPKKQLVRGLNFDLLLYQEMSDRILTDGDDYLEPLQPDLVGEFFVDEFLKRKPSQRQNFVNWAWTTGAAGAAVFAAMVEADYGTTTTDPLRYLPSHEVWTADMARQAARALGAITIFYERRLWEQDPSKAPPWLIPKPVKSDIIGKLRDAFQQSREAPPRRELGTGGGLDAGF